MAAATNKNALKPVTKTHLTLCVVQNPGPERDLADDLHHLYKDLEEQTTLRNDGRKDVITTNGFSIYQHKSESPSTPYQYVIANCDHTVAAFLEEAIADHAECDRNEKIKYERKYAMVYCGMDAIRYFSEPPLIAQHNPALKRVAVSEKTLQETLAPFGLNAGDLTAESLKDKTDIDLLLVSDKGLSEDDKAVLPKNVMTLAANMFSSGNVAKKINAQFLGVK